MEKFPSILIDGRSVSRPSKAGLIIDVLASFREKGNQEMIFFVPNGPVLTCLRSGERCFLMYLHKPGDAGFSSRTSETAAEDWQDTVPFTLSNGQVDAYPAAWTIPLADGLEACRIFFQHQSMDPQVHWHKD